jgi:REP element-mobilizing transposase RayT
MNCENDRKLLVTRRRLPHWFLKGSTYFITFKVESDSLSLEERTLVLDHIKSGDGKHYLLHAAVILSDHVHLLIQPNEGMKLSAIMKGLKGVTARKINLMRRARGSVWQDESYDRIVRHYDEFMEKLNYMLMNPVKAGLTDDPWRYKAWYWRGWQ